jgi:hypothetical protein
VFWVSQQQYESGGGSTGEVQSLAFQGENPRSGLNWLCVVGEAGCNWYLLILINSLYQKTNKHANA